MRPILLLYICVSSTYCAFHKEFREFLVDHYGEDVAVRLSRTDMGEPGSFGGGGLMDENGMMRRSDVQAAILIHGVVGVAGHLNRIRWKIRGGHMVFGTTWGQGGRGGSNAALVDMKCAYIKHVRLMIQAVAAYTRRKVDVIGYSMGSPVSRKAILGGACVETGEHLGPPLTALVDTFVSVAGANQGSYLCILPFPGTCNAVNGLSCFSRFLRDLNSRHHFEGSHVFSIYSRGDDKVGFQNGCGARSSLIHGADREIEVSGNHDQVMFDSWSHQLALIQHHSYP